jgi:vacuolar-type H+-ATPase subunit I/STV1
MAKPKKRGAKKLSKTSKQVPADPCAPIITAFATLHEVGDLLRRRLAEIDPLDHPTRWSAVNDQIRDIEDRLGELRGEHQRVAMARAELRELAGEELAALQAATTRLAGLVRAAERVVALTEAAGTLLLATTKAIEKLRA